MQKHYVAWGDWCSDIRTLQDAEEIVAAYAASEVDPEIERLKAALRWCLDNAGVQGISLDAKNILDFEGNVVETPPQFADVIAEAVKS